MKRIEILGALALLSLASCATAPKETVAAAPVSHTEIRPMQINTEPQGAAIIVEGQNLGLSPVWVNVEVDSATGKFAHPIYVAPMPTGPGQYTQAGLIGFPFQVASPALTLFMYNTR
jgi:hypothetical protein